MTPTTTTRSARLVCALRSHAALLESAGSLGAVALEPRARALLQDDVETIAGALADRPGRSYGVCVGGALIDERDEYSCPLLALRRAEYLRLTIDAGEPVQVLLWPASDDDLEVMLDREQRGEIPRWRVGQEVVA